MNISTPDKYNRCSCEFYIFLDRRTEGRKRMRACTSALSDLFSFRVCIALIGSTTQTLAYAAAILRICSDTVYSVTFFFLLHAHTCVFGRKVLHVNCSSEQTCLSSTAALPTPLVFNPRLSSLILRTQDNDESELNSARGIEPEFCFNSIESIGHRGSARILDLLSKVGGTHM